MQRKTKKGFTLVELLVVIAILAILATVSVIGYSTYLQKSQDSAATTELSQLVGLVKVEKELDAEAELAAVVASCGADLPGTIVVLNDDIYYETKNGKGHAQWDSSEDTVKEITDAAFTAAEAAANP